MSHKPTDTSRRRIPASGINLFQLIYILLREYEQKSGLKALNLSLGNPDLTPVEEVRALKAEFQRRPDFELHTYAEESNINQFCEGLLESFIGLKIADYPTLRAIPIPGIKTMTALLPLACGLHFKRSDFVMASNLPAYDVAGTWEETYLGARRVVWPLASEDHMTLNLERLKSALSAAQVSTLDLVMVIRPGNPAARGASREEWVKLIEFCRERKARLVNDAAYTTLAEDGTHVPLAMVAKDYPDLEWAEMFSISKSFSDPGARLGVIVGSREFMEDAQLIKGNTESGPVPGIMAAYGELFKNKALTNRLLTELRSLYRARLDYLVPALRRAGLRQACETNAGFFTLWQVPRKAYGLDIRAEAARASMTPQEYYNRLVIDRTGIVGVHFKGGATKADPQGEPLIRYAVCTDVLAPEFRKRFEAAINEIKPEY